MFKAFVRPLCVSACGLALTTVMTVSAFATTPYDAASRELLPTLKPGETITFDIVDERPEQTVLAGLYKMESGAETDLYVTLNPVGDTWKIKKIERPVDDAHLEAVSEAREVMGLPQGKRRRWAAQNGITALEALKQAAYIVRTGRTDAGWIDHFRTNQQLFETIRERAAFSPIKTRPDSKLWIRSGYMKTMQEEAWVDYGFSEVPGDEGHVMGARRIGNGCQGGLECFSLVTTVGPGDVKTGFFYTTDEANVPHITDRGYMVIRSLGDNWYFFRSR